MPAGDDLSLFHDALKATLIANGVLGKVRAELKVAALEAVRRQPPHDDDMDAPDAVGAHIVDTSDDAQALAHALVLDFLMSQPTLSRSASVFESEAGVERLNSGLRSREGLERAAGVAGSSPNEPLLVSLLRRPGGLGGGGSGSQATSLASSPTRMPVKRQARPVIAPAEEDQDDDAVDDEATPASTPAESAAASNLSSPERASGAGPSFSVAKAARWPAGNRTGGISREASIEFSDATADASVEEGIDWDYVEGAEGARSSTGGGGAASSSPVLTAKPAAAAVTHSDPTAAAPPAAAASAAAASSMVPPDDTDSDEEEGDAAPASGGAPLMTTGDSDGDDDGDDDMYGGFEDDDDEF